MRYGSIILLDTSWFPLMHSSRHHILKLGLDFVQVFAVDWSPDGEKVASGGKDKVLKLWMG